MFVVIISVYISFDICSMALQSLAHCFESQGKLDMLEVLDTSL